MIFDSVIGHEKIILKLKSILAHKPVATKSLIFCGPSGIGKRKIALGWAQGLLCREKEAPCGTCHSCMRIANLRHPDLLIIDSGESATLKIEQIRQAQNFVSLKPYEGLAKVVIIDEAHAMTTQASNSLLKTLEEPPNDSHFVLVTSNRGALLSTIQSRCQKVLFGNLTFSQLKKTVPECEDWILQMAQGSAELAMKLTDDNHRKIRAATMRFLSNLPKTRYFEGFMSLSHLCDEKETCFFVTQCLIRTFKISLSLKLGCEVEYSPDESEAIGQLKAHFSKERLMSLSQKIIRLEQDLMANVNKNLAFEKFFIDTKSI